ncbi:MAG: hypothetical protein J6A53_00790 [Clostridia bacterium]|nr:hypothetical protein [Clostridia bacterium]
MSDRDKKIIFLVLKALYIFTILCSFFALKLELGAYLGEIPREQVDTTYMLDCIIISVFILNGFAFLFFKYE